MSPFAGAALLLVVLLVAGADASIVPDVDFFRDCPPSRCSAGGPEVRYPLRLTNSSPPFCGAPGLDLYCSGNDIVVEFPTSERYRVTGIDYEMGSITIDIGDWWSSCLSKEDIRNRINGSRFGLFENNYEYIFVNCSVEIATDGGARKKIRGPISCLGGVGHFAYAVSAVMEMDMLPAACEVWCPWLAVPRKLLTPAGSDVNCSHDSRAEFELGWGTDDTTRYDCLQCEERGCWCGFSRRENKTTCYGLPSFPSRRSIRSPVSLIAGTSFAGVVVITVALVFLYRSRKPSRAEETRLKVEKFLATYKTTKPTRYRYSDIKKITKRFRCKLGQGGFGSVYKGELPNGIPVAVKMLHKTMGNGDEFINEVATTGRIHHVNVVRLLGFCSDGPRRALVYEFMPNESLEKFIFAKHAKSRQSLSWERVEEIALGVAQGIEYLHLGCNERILHFDIKPHNILLDHNFHPKISDFGLAKLCSKDRSTVSMTMARGTLGYIAPEIYSRNFGTVSHKSDVYSFGMLLMEMISGKKTVEPTVESNSQVYFPEQIYERLVRGEDLTPDMVMEGGEETARKLAIVSLWCIQWNPSDRPPMTSVVQMLTGNLQDLQLPPIPFSIFS